MPVISKITGAPFRFWCQKILPAVYDDSLSYYELLCKVVDYLNKVMEDDINVVNLVNELEEFVNNYFNNLDVQQEINNKLDAMAEDGSLLAVVAPHLDDIITQYEAELDEDLATYKGVINADIAEFKGTVNDAIDAQDTDIVNFKNTVNGQVSAQNTEIEDFKSTVNTSMTQQNSDISVMQSQMNSFIDSYSDMQTFTTLFESTEQNGGHYEGQSITLSDPYTDYTELDIYWSYLGDVRVTRVSSADVLANGVVISWFADSTATQPTSPAPLNIPLMSLVNGNSDHTALTISTAYAETWTGLSTDSAVRNSATTNTDYDAGSIIRIIGVEYQASAELTDIRVGCDGITYANAGSAVRDVASKFTVNTVSVPTSAIIDGYVNNSGEVAGTGSNCRHVAFTIDGTKLGKTFYITGTSWWSMKPWVFVATDSEITYADVPSTSGTVVEHSNLVFKPSKTGILYNNWHTDSGKHAIDEKVLGALKTEEIPTNFADTLVDYTTYEQLQYTTITGKYISASTGEITDVTGAQSERAVITDYIEVKGNTPYVISTEHFWSQGMYVFFDENYNYITGKAANSGSTITYMRVEKVVSPLNAKYVVIGQWTQGNPVSIYIAEGVSKPLTDSSKWSGIKWTCIGDSLTEYNEKTKVHYYDYIAEETGIERYIMGIGGTGYARGIEYNRAFCQTSVNVPFDSDVITIFGSFNDLGSELPLGNIDDSGITTIAGCVNTTIQNILSINPVANIGIIAPTPWGTTQPSSSGNAYNYVKLLEDICHRWSIPFLNLWYESGLKPWNTAFSAIAYPADDTVHPNEVGHKIISSKIKSFLETLIVS